MIKSLILAFQFLTRLPLNFNVDVNERNTKYAIALFPAVGLFIGAFICAVKTVALKAGADSLLSSALTLASWIWITGAMHLDGVSDMADGFMSNRGRERTLEIMKDSRIGAFGVIVLIVFLLLKFTAINRFINGDIPFLLAPCLGRYSACIMISFAPMAEGSSMGSHLHSSKPGKAVIAVGAVTVIALAALNFMLLFAFAGALLTQFLLRAVSTKKIGGVSGDIYGATVEFSELVALLILGGVS